MDWRASLAQSPVVPALRAAFVLFHASMVVLLSLPLPHSAPKASALSSSSAQEILKLIADLRGVSKAEAQAEVLALGASTARVRDLFEGVFGPYAAATGSTQSWTMFGVVPPETGRVVLEVDQGQGYTVLWRARDPEHAWNARLFDDERLRGLMNGFAWGRDRKRYEKVVDWLAERVRRERPQAVRVRVAVEVLTIGEEGLVEQGRRWESERAIGGAP